MIENRSTSTKGSGLHTTVSRAPCRIDLIGAPTDLPLFYLEHGGQVVNAAINKYLTVVVQRVKEPGIVIESSIHYERVKSAHQILHPMVRAVLSENDINDHVYVFISSDITPYGSGLGSSAALIMGLLRAVYSCKGLERDNEFFYDEACRIEIEVMGRGIGKQDQIPSAFGGLRSINFGKDGKITHELIDCSKVSQYLFLYDTKIPRDADKLTTEDSNDVNTRLTLKQLAIEATGYLKSNDMEPFGKLLDYSMSLRKKLKSSYVPAQVDPIYDRALSLGAWGGTMQGAGGGGTMLLVVPPDARSDVSYAMKFAGLTEIPFCIEQQGSQVQRTNESTAINTLVNA